MLEWMFLTGLFFQFLSFLTGGAAFSSPFWVGHTTEDCHYGMMVMCTNGTCSWFYEKHWKYTTEQISGWLQCGRVVYACGLLFSLTGIVSAALRACCCRTSVRTACLVTVLAALAFCGIGVPTGIFGTKTHRNDEVTFSGPRWCYEWGYFLALTSAFCSLIAPLLQIYSEYRQDSSYFKDGKLMLVNEDADEDS